MKVDKLIIALVVVLLVVAMAIWVVKLAKKTRHSFSNTVSEGGTLSVDCGEGKMVTDVDAKFGPASGSASSCETVDVTGKVKELLAAGTPITVTAQNLGVSESCAEPRALTVKYNCSTAAGEPFVPGPAAPCVSHCYDGTMNLGGDTLFGGTVARVPYSTQSKVSLTGGGEAPSLRQSYQPANPISGIGKASYQRLWSDASMPDTTCAWRDSIFELQHGQPGYVEATLADTTDGTPYQGRYYVAGDPTAAWSYGHKNAAGGPYHGITTCPSTPMPHDGVISDHAWSLHSSRSPGAAGGLYGRENLTSRRRHEVNPLTASQTGLGSIRRDPRFEPGPQRLYPGGDAIYAHGGHSGGPTFGSYTEYRFMPGNTWDAKYIHGFGDAHLIEGRKYPWEN